MIAEVQNAIYCLLIFHEIRKAKPKVIAIANQNKGENRRTQTSLKTQS